MKPIYGCAAILILGVASAAAQDSTVADKAKADAMQAKLQAEQKSTLREMQLELQSMGGIRGMVMGPPVKGAPYSGEEVRTSLRVLADGTRIENDSRTTVYRDSEGRIRRETPNEISIFDPTNGVSYVLNPKDNTARKLQTSVSYKFTTSGKDGATETKTFVMASGTGGRAGRGVGTGFGYGYGTEPTAASTRVVAIPGGSYDIAILKDQVTNLESRKKESLGTQTFEGINSEGSRTTSTIDMGAIGNDRPIQIVHESWYSAELQTEMMSVHKDPLQGDETFKLVNVHRGEPDPSLFQPPAGYTVIDRK